MFILMLTVITFDIPKEYTALLEGEPLALLCKCPVSRSRLNPGPPGMVVPPSATGKIFKVLSGSICVFLGEFFIFSEPLLPYL